jgi:hypothetical protein
MAVIALPGRVLAFSVPVSAATALPYDFQIPSMEKADVESTTFSPSQGGQRS